MQLAETVVGAVLPETNMWESTSVAGEDARIVAFAVGSESDEGRGIESLSNEEQAAKAARVRFAPVKKWDDYNDPSKQALIRHAAARLLEADLI